MLGEQWRPGLGLSDSRGPPKPPPASLSHPAAPSALCFGGRRISAAPAVSQRSFKKKKNKNSPVLMSEFVCGLDRTQMESLAAGQTLVAFLSVPHAR